MASSPGGGVELTVVVPTFDELSNIVPLLATLNAALVGVDYVVPLGGTRGFNGLLMGVRAGGGSPG